jgi:hypothetical protein
MHFPRFWALGKEGSFSAWGWSDSSLDEARSRAGESARRAAAHLARDEAAGRRYAYGERPLREPVLGEIEAPSGEIDAVVTRNSYGALVLNTARVMFIDVDASPQAAGGQRGGLLRRWFGRSAAAAPEPGPSSGTPAKAEEWTRRNPGWGWRVYRTRAGFRLLATHELFDAASAVEGPVFQELGADPLYGELCKAQGSFRARLTPKPWRCGIGNPPERWPFADAGAEARFQEWERRYRKACEGKAVCDLVAVVGNPEVHAGVRDVLALHDKMTGAESKLPLA